ncbi:unnamed protein product [Eretmochelys imbricata]
MQRGQGWVLLAALLIAGLGRPASEAFKMNRRPARTRTCADRPEELLEQLYGRLTAGMLSAFHHTLQLEPLEKDHNVSCPAGGRAASEKKYRLPINLHSVSPWSYSTPVYMPTVILRRTSACAGGRYVYTEDYVTIPVGCTCVPEQEKEADSVNSSIDKQEMKLLVNQNDKPASE